MKIERKPYVNPEMVVVVIENEPCLISPSDVKEGSGFGEPEDPDDPDPWG